MPAIPPDEFIRWYAERTGRSDGALLELRQSLARLVRERVAGHMQSLCGQRAVLDGTSVDGYQGRAWLCVEHHARQVMATDAIPFEQFLDQLESGRLAYGQVAANVLEEVILAHGLELGEAEAANRFERDYMPAVRRVAQKVGGQRAVEGVENFAAELVLPRENHPPRIATFAGRTPLVTWLRTVVVNYWVTQTRREKFERPAETPAIVHREMPDHQVDGVPCRQLLEPVFRSAAGAIDAEDRLLLKLLLLDGVPQKDVARAMKLNSGTITRRRQKAAEQVLLGVQRQVALLGRPQQTQRCLELALTGDLPELRTGLADVLAMAVTTHQDRPGAKEAQS